MDTEIHPCESRRQVLPRRGTSRRFLIALMVLAGATIGGCGGDRPEWLLIEYPSSADQSLMRFPGVEASTLDECVQQSKFVLQRGTADANAERTLSCGSRCRFSRKWGSPLCDTLITVHKPEGR